jgi:hypothetical protein
VQDEVGFGYQGKISGSYDSTRSFTASTGSMP